MDKSLSVIIPALNEERHLENTVGVVTEVARKYFDTFEIIIVDDGSTDDTGAIADRLAETNSSITVVHHEKPHNLGGAYKSGLSLAKMHYVSWVAGKNDITPEELSRLWALRGQADMIVPYAINSFERPIMRRVFSYLFTLLINTLFGTKLNYYNHFVLCERSTVRSIQIRSDSYAFQAEALVKLVKMGHSVIEVPFRDYFGHDTATKAFVLKNLCGVAKFVFWMIHDIYFTDRYHGKAKQTCK